MKYLIFFVLLLSFDLYAQSKMEVCKQEIENNCGKQPLKECIEEGKVSKDCASNINALNSLGNTSMAMCSDITKLCKIEFPTKGGPSLKERMANFQKCFKEKMDLLPEKCKSYIKYLNRDEVRSNMNRALDYKED